MNVVPPPDPSAVDTPDIGDIDIYFDTDQWDEVEELEGRVDELVSALDQVIDHLRRTIQCHGHELSCVCDAHVVVRLATEARG